MKDTTESCEMAAMYEEGATQSYQSTNPNNPFAQSNVAEESFIGGYQQGSYQQGENGHNRYSDWSLLWFLCNFIRDYRQASMQSVDFYASSEEGCEGEGGGRHGAKISEWQAAWNVTNAIQV
jgi:hypothetical protein